MKETRRKKSQYQLTMFLIKSKKSKRVESSTNSYRQSPRAAPTGGQTGWSECVFTGYLQVEVAHAADAGDRRRLLSTGDALPDATFAGHPHRERTSCK